MFLSNDFKTISKPNLSFLLKIVVFICHYIRHFVAIFHDFTIGNSKEIQKIEVIIKIVLIICQEQSFYLEMRYIFLTTI